jgi:hypothetical protein
MFRRLCSALGVAVLGLGIWLGGARTAAAQYPTQYPQSLQRFFYYPYYYFPHNYWPAQGPKWPEPVGAPYLRPPAYMAYPPFLEPNWRYDLWEPARFYHGFHFWLDQF